MNALISALRGCWFAGVSACVIAGLLGACAPVRTVLETREGIEISLRPERREARPAPGPEFRDLKDYKIARSLERVVVRYGKVISFNLSDPAPLFSEGQVRALTEVLLRELPALPAGQRLGLAFYDQYRGDIVDVELYPEGDNLVYEFRALMVLKENGMRRRGSRSLNYGVLVPQRDQIVDDSLYPLLKDPIASAARPDFHPPPEGDKKKEESPL
jgi:hypothetical protein